MTATPHKGKPYRDDLPTVTVSSLRRSRAITIDTLWVMVSVGALERQVRVRHSMFPGGGSRSFFICPSCANQAVKLRLYDGRIACRRCDGDLIYRCQGHDKTNRIERLRQALYGPNPHKHYRKRLERALRRALIVERQQRLDRAAL